MENITVTIKAVDLNKLLRLANGTTLDISWRDRKIKELETEIANLKHNIEQLKQKENEE